MDSTVPANKSANLITSLDQAELKIRRAGIIRLTPEGYEQVEGKQARQEAIDDKREKQLARHDTMPALHKPGIYQPELSTPQDLLEINMATSLKAIAFAEALGFTGSQKPWPCPNSIWPLSAN